MPDVVDSIFYSNAPSLHDGGSKEIYQIYEIFPLNWLVLKGLCDS